MRSWTRVAPWLLLIGVVFAAPSREEAPFYDPERSLNEQREAVDAAKAQVGAGISPRDVLAYFTDDSALVRDAVFELIAEQNDPRMLEALSKQVGHRDPFVAATVAELLGRCRSGDGRRALEKALGHRHPWVALESIWALEALGEAESADALAKAFKRRREYRVKGDALIALARIDPEQAAEHVQDALDDKQPAVRIAGLVALRLVDQVRAVEAAVAVIGADALDRKERGWEPRLLFAALETLYLWEQRAGQPELAVRAIEACLTRLDREEGLPQHKLGLALEDLTGAEGIADDALAWRGWWDARKDGFTPQDKQLDRDALVDEPGLPQGVAPAGPSRPVTGDDPGAKTRVRFHGIPVHSKRMIFAQDISGGMNNPLDKDEGDEPTKMAFSKAELERVLNALGEDVGVNVVFFATEYYRPAEQLVPLGANRERLIAFVREQETPNWRKEELKHASRSNLFDALSFMLQDPEIDTVYFLSEGGPNSGRFTDHDRFMTHLARLNVYQRVQVHTLQVTSSKTLSKFLRRLARLTGGQFYDLDFLKQHRQ